MLWKKAIPLQRGACKGIRVRIMLASAYFPTHNYAVSSAMRSLTSGFGMGPGVPSSLWTPANLLFLRTGSCRDIPARLDSKNPSIFEMDRFFIFWQERRSILQRERI